ncbi:S1 family peptidase [Nonomuraea recticatena]|uniref:Alpha-lytic protease prodomain-containing protein n=1 Tax=Nonomuraea recticatena TaxID=46178 RepID=A0ABN3RI55_9ACTN
MLRTRTLIAIAIGALALTATPAVASAPAGNPPDGLVKAMQRDLNLTEEQAKKRLVNEQKAGRTAPGLAKRLGADYAGAWVEGPESTLVVATTNPSQRRVSGAELRVVAHSLAKLDAAKEALDKAADKAPKTAPVWYVDVPTNSVVILSSAPADAEAFIAASGADKALIRVEQSNEQPVPYADIRGGDAYYIGSGSRCSVGFSVTKPGTNGGFVTAGHCGSVGATTRGANQQAQGTFRGSSFPGNDYAWVEVNTSWTPVGVVNGYSAGIIPVNGSTVAPVGSSICRAGSTTGWHCGTVQQLNTSVTYPQGTVNEVTRTSVCAEPGDSGGSYISGNQAQGVTSGGSGNCSSGGTTYFQPVNEILSAYGLTLVTGGGNPPTGCQNYRETYNGSLASGANQYQPNNSYYQSTVSGTHAGCLDGPSGVDFDLYLQKWNGSSWATVATSDSPNPDESISYNGSAGYYRYRVHAYSGSGSYTLGVNRP